VAFTTVSDDKDKPKNDKNNKDITCFRCKKVGHYSRKCEEELPPRQTKKDPLCLFWTRTALLNVTIR